MATKLVNVESIGSYFESLSDPRHTRNRKHLLVDIVVIAVCGILCGSDGPTAIHRWAEQSPGLAGAVPLASQRNSLTRLHSSAADGAEARGLPEVLPGLDHRTRSETDDSSPERLIAIDGKTCRRSHDASKELGALHIVSAWASEEGIALGQVATEAKSNEITAIPELLKQIELTDSLDHDRRHGLPERDRARHRRRRWRFRDRLKDNQPKLREAIEDVLRRTSGA